MDKQNEDQDALTRELFPSLYENTRPCVLGNNQATIEERRDLLRHALHEQSPSAMTDMITNWGGNWMSTLSTTTLDSFEMKPLYLEDIYPDVYPAEGQAERLRNVKRQNDALIRERQNANTQNANTQNFNTQNVNAQCVNAQNANARKTNARNAHAGISPFQEDDSEPFDLSKFFDLALVDTEYQEATSKGGEDQLTEDRDAEMTTASTHDAAATNDFPSNDTAPATTGLSVIRPGMKRKRS